MVKARKRVTATLPTPSAEAVFTDLPQDVLVRIANNLDLYDRLCSLSLVCKAFYEASCVIKQLTLHQRVPQGVLDWYLKRVQHIRSLSVTSHTAPTEKPSFRLCKIVTLLAFSASAAPGGTLRKLTIAQPETLSCGVLAPIGRLLKLRELSLHGLMEEPVHAAFAELRPLTELQVLELSHCRVKFKFSSVASFWQTIAELSSLQELSLTDFPAVRLLEPDEGMPPLLSLRTLKMKKMDAWFPRDLSTLTGLEDLELRGVTAWPRPLLLDRLTCLKHLRLDSTREVAAAQASSVGFGTLSALMLPPALGLLGIYGSSNALLPFRSSAGPGCLKKGFGGSHATLRAVYLENCGLAAVPPELAAMDELYFLSLASNALTDLPAGAYLSKLAVLDLRRNSFSQLPLSLPDCENLDVLFLSGCDRLELKQQTADVLLEMPGLLRVYMDRSHDWAAENFAGTPLAKSYAALKKIMKVLSSHSPKPMQSSVLDPLYDGETPVDPKRMDALVRGAWSSVH